MRLWKPSGILKDEHPRLLNINIVPVRGRASSGRSFTFSEIILYISVKFLYTAFTPPEFINIYKSIY